jgi:predicted lipid-binding transport protein (Tim44 family)
MSDFFDPYSIIFLALAVAILFRLRNVLGKRTGSERPPFDPYSSREAENSTPSQSGDNIVSLPRSDASEDFHSPSDEEIEERADQVAPEGSSLNQALKTIMAADGTFDPVQFLVGSKAAYEMIVGAFAAGDRKALKNLLSSEVYNGFVSAIDERESRGEVIDSTFIGIDKADIVEAEMKDETAQITVRFKSQLISATRDSSREIIDGDTDNVVEVTDIWTFARDARSNDPNWNLIATESAG